MQVPCQVVPESVGVRFEVRRHCPTCPEVYMSADPIQRVDGGPEIGTGRRSPGIQNKETEEPPEVSRLEEKLQQNGFAGRERAQER